MVSIGQYADLVGFSALGGASAYKRWSGCSNECRFCSGEALSSSC